LERDVLHFNQEMDVIAHEHIGIGAKMVALFVGGKNAEIFLEVRWFFEYLLLLVPPGDDVIKSAVVFYPRLSCHDWKVADIKECVNNSIFKSNPRGFPGFQQSNIQNIAII
jgi:hypothetical protein